MQRRQGGGFAGSGVMKWIDSDLVGHSVHIECKGIFFWGGGGVS